MWKHVSRVDLYQHLSTFYLLNFLSRSHCLTHIKLFVSCRGKYPSQDAYTCVSSAFFSFDTKPKAKKVIKIIRMFCEFVSLQEVFPVDISMNYFSLFFRITHLKFNVFDVLMKTSRSRKKKTHRKRKFRKPN